MFEELFKRPSVLARHKSAPYAQERERYLSHCAQQGYARATLLVLAYELLWVARRLSVHPELKVTTEQIRVAAKGWAQREHHCGHVLNKRWTRTHGGWPRTFPNHQAC